MTTNPGARRCPAPACLINLGHHTVRSLHDSEERLRLALDAGKMAVWDWRIDTDAINWNDEHFRMLGYDIGSLTPTYWAWRERVHIQDLHKVEAQLENALKDGTNYTAEYRVVWPNGSIRWLSAFGRVELADDKKPIRLYGVMLDETERKENEEHKSILLKEISHRAKNLLTVVQSIAQITSAQDSPETFYKSFANRLRGLAASQDLLVESEWMKVDLHDLITSQLPHFGALFGKRILLQGPQTDLNPSAAQAIGMAIHELGTNAAKYGALSVASGNVNIEWEIEKDLPDVDPSLVIHWSEQGGPSVRPPQRQGFGHTVIVEAPEHVLSADVTLAFPPSGITWTLKAPLNTVFAASKLS